MNPTSTSSFVTPPISYLLRFEGAMTFFVACGLYYAQSFFWWQFALWFFLPDIAILVYFLGKPRLGMWAYNLTHSTIGAGLVGMIGVFFYEPLGIQIYQPLGIQIDQSLCFQIALIWFAHIGFDRALGFGLKLPQGFRVTHLGCVGRKHK